MAAVRCTRGNVQNGGIASYLVEFIQFATIPHENNVRYHEADIDLSRFTCDSTSATGLGVSCSLSFASSTAPPGTTYCFLLFIIFLIHG